MSGKPSFAKRYGGQARLELPDFAKRCVGAGATYASDLDLGVSGKPSFAKRYGGQARLECA